MRRSEAPLRNARRLRPAWLALASALLLAAPSLASAQGASKAASGSVTIFRPISVSSTSNISFGRLQTDAGHTGGTVTVSDTAPAQIATSGSVHLLGAGTVSNAVRQISGEPGRVYIVSFPASVPASPGGYAVSAFTVRSANSGEITSSRTGTLSASGADTLTIGATMTLPGGVTPNAFTATVPVTVTYQ